MTSSEVLSRDTSGFHKFARNYDQGDSLNNELSRKWIRSASRSVGYFQLHSRLYRNDSRQTRCRHIDRSVLPVPAVAAESHGRAYLFRGLIGMIDWGMDELAGRINRTGLQANIDSHLTWRSIADQAISDYRRDP
jgi:hypothetical protein